MKIAIMQVALRETQKTMRSHKVQSVLIAVAIILGLAGPFGTEDAMRLVPRILYWTAMAQVTFASGTFVSVLSQRMLQGKGVAHWGGAGLSGLAIGLVICIEIFIVNWAIFTASPLEAGYALPLLINVIVVAVIIRIAIAVILHAPENAEDSAKNNLTQTPPKLLNRLPFEKRGQIISLSVNDHYVDVVTTKGTEMVLIRLADAIIEAGNGFQVHRSHWVARNHIISVTREGAKAVIKTSDGRDIPVSRTYVPVLKEAGFLS